MKLCMIRFAVCCLAVLLLFNAAGITAAAAEDYGDIGGHWAEKTLRRALEDGYLVGSEGLLRPDAPITGAEAVTILTRVISGPDAGTAEATDLSDAADLSSDDWYYMAAAKAVAMGILAPENGRLQLEEALSRERAFLMLANAFQLAAAGQEDAVLSPYTDSGRLTGRMRAATAALADGGHIQGYGDALHTYKSITRAEFMSVLYSIVPHIQTGARTAPGDGNALFTGVSRLYDTAYPGWVFLGGGAADVSLYEVEAPAVVIRSDRLDTLQAGFSKIGRLVIAAAGGDVSFNPGMTNELPVVAVGDGAGRVTLSGRFDQVEITGSNRTVILDARVNKLRVSGSGNTVRLGDDAQVSELTVYPEGANNTIELNGTTIESCTLYGPGTVISGRGLVKALTDNAQGSDITAPFGQRTVNKDYGLGGVEVTLTAPDTLPPDRALEAAVTVTAPQAGKACHGAWYLDGRYIDGTDLVLGDEQTLTVSIDVPRTADVPVSAELTFVLSHTGADGIRHALTAAKTVTVEPQPVYTAQEVLSLVTTGYRGDYTLAWAEENDYTPQLKEAFVNVKGYTSKTQYLVWVSIAYQRVNIFSGSAGNWKLEKCFIVGTGAPGSATPTGVFQIFNRHTRGWTTKEYTVRPVINFINYAYGFHSRLYYPNSSELRDSRIGFPVSHGCIRMYDEDVNWMYDNLPDGTTVVVY